MSYSNLVEHVRISPNSTNPRNKKIDAIVIHHMAGNATVESCGALFADPAREASSNYGIGTDGRIACYVEEENRAWTTGSREIDNRAITFEVANCSGAPEWKVSDQALEATIALCVDICRRYGFKLNYTGDKSGNLHMHKWYQNTDCPGKYLESKFPYIAEEVNRRLGNKTEEKTENTVIFRVQVGAYTVKEYADDMLGKVKAAGFDTYMVKVDGMYKIQVGAYKLKPNADAMLDRLKRAGFDGFITTKGGTPVAAEPVKKSVEELAQEVIQGKWGNGTDRKNRLIAAGYDYAAVQKRVNALMKG